MVINGSKYQYLSNVNQKSSFHFLTTVRFQKHVCQVEILDKILDDFGIFNN